MAARSEPPLSSYAGALPARDFYAEFLYESRGLSEERLAERTRWFENLAVDNKHALLFEFEVLLKGLACYANPKNHPGPRRTVSLVAQNFSSELDHYHAGLARLVKLSQRLLARADRAFVFQRYLESVLDDDTSRSRLVRSTQDSIEDSLLALRQGLTSLQETTAVVARSDRVAYRTFYALASLAQREVSTSAYFNPLTAVEFAPEHDRAPHPRLVALFASLESQESRRLLTLTTLSLLRLRKYLSLAQAISRRESRRETRGPLQLVLSVLHSDARALVRYIDLRAGDALARGYERDLLRTPAVELVGRARELRSNGAQLRELREALTGIAASLRAELKRAFERELAPSDSDSQLHELRAQVDRAASHLEPALENGVLVLGRVLGIRLDDEGLFADYPSRRARSERLRLDVWMLAQVVRAFLEKVRALPLLEERWDGPPTMQFARDFVHYFRAMGYPLLRSADHPQVAPFLLALARLLDSDHVDPIHVEHAARHAEGFRDYLLDLHARIGEREELSGVAFDRRSGAEQLKLYLGL